MSNIKQEILVVKSNQKLTDSVYKMTLYGATTKNIKPGQFINLKIDGLYLRRPISVYDISENEITIIYKVVGRGTELLSSFCEGKEIDTLTELGNGYDLALSGEKPLLLGGGVGVPPLYYLAKELIKKGARPTVILGFNTASEVFCREDFEALGCETLVTTADGSEGIKGFVTDAIPSDYSYFYCCGPEPMLKAVYKATKTGGEFSFEERMGCGFGACMGCSCKTITGYKRICKDGPVMKKEEILWEG